jgi:hypothetical protein
MCRTVTRHYQIHRTSGPGSLKTIEQIRGAAFQNLAVGYHIHARERQNVPKSGLTVYVAVTRIKCDINLTVNPFQRIAINKI